MRNKNKNAALRLTLLLVVMLLIGGISAWAQPLPDPVAHYPLRVDKYRNYIVVEPWDVSGNALHGSTYNTHSGGDTLMDPSFRRINFPDTSVAGVGYSYPCLQKEGTDSAYINIPSSVYNSTYTISFWFYYDGTMASFSQNIIQLPSLQVEMSVKKLFVNINNGSTLTRKYANNVVSDSDPGWYFIGIKSSDSAIVRKYQGSAAKYELVSTTNGTAYSTSISQIAGASFRSGLNNVRFYNQVLNDAQIDSIYKQDTSVAAKMYDTSMYMFRNVYAHYPLSSSDFKKNISRFSGRNGTAISGVTGATDRFSRTDSAASFSTSNAYITLPSFWGTYMDDYKIYTNDTPNPKGFTISYWMHITTNMSTPAGGINMPFDGSTHRTKVFYGRQSGEDLFGMQEILDRIGIFRYNDITATRYPWYLWLYDPMSFRNDIGWYHIVWVQYQDWMRMYIYKPDGEMVCNSYYIEIPEAIKSLTDWGLGNNAGTSASQTLILDDFKIFNWPLSPYDVNGLDSIERPPNGPYAKPCRSCLTMEEEDWDAHITRLEQDKFIMYPNPASDKVTLQMNVNEEEHIYLNVSGIDGRVYMRKEYDLVQGKNVFVLNDLEMPPGNYFVTITNSKSLNGSYKFTLLPH